MSAGESKRVGSRFALTAVFISVSALAWCYGGIMGEKLWWVSPPAIVLLGISLIVGRRREMLRDPFLYVALSLILLLALPFLNTSVRSLPYCFNRLGHLNVFLWFAPTLLAALSVRLVMDDADKLLLLELLAVNGFLLGVLGWVQLAVGARAPLWMPLPPNFQTTHFFSAFGYPNMSGDYFTTLAGLSAGLALYEKGVRRLVFAGMSVFAVAGAFASLSRGAIMLCSVLVVVLLIRIVLAVLRAADSVRRRLLIPLAAVSTAVALSGAVLLLPDDVKLDFSETTVTKVCQRLTGESQYHVRLALEMWRDHPLFGIGGWGYKYFTRPYAKRHPGLRIQTIGGINVHNDPTQFLAEHGAVGFALILASVALLVAPLVRRWREPLVFAALLVCSLTIVHSFGDAIFRSPAIMSLFAVILASVNRTRTIFCSGSDKDLFTSPSCLEMGYNVAILSPTRRNTSEQVNQDNGETRSDDDHR